MLRFQQGCCCFLTSVASAALQSVLSLLCQSKQEHCFHILVSYLQVGRLQPERGIPAAVLRGAAGFAILSVFKVSYWWVLSTIGRAQLPAASIGKHWKHAALGTTSASHEPASAATPDSAPVLTWSNLVTTFETCQSCWLDDCWQAQ